MKTFNRLTNTNRMKPLQTMLLSAMLATSATTFSPMSSTVVWAAQSWQINLQDADVKAFVNEVADITGKDFVLDPRVNGKVTVVSHRPLNKNEVYELFLGVLDVNGIIAIPSGKTIKLVPDNVAKQKGVDVDLRRNSQGSKLVTRVIPLKNTKVAEILPVVRPLLPQFAHVAAVPSVNSLVVSDRASSLNQLEELIYSLDGGEHDSFETIALTYTSPENMLELISGISGISTKSTNASSRLRLVADANNDRLIVKGSAESRAYIRKLVKKLDTKPTRRLSGLKVFKLKYASAAHIAQMLRGLLNHQSLNSTGAKSTLQASTALTGNANSGSALGSTNRSGSTPSQAGNTGSGTAGSSRTKEKPFSIIADETQNAIVVNAPSGLMQDIKEAIEALDTRRAQVLIQAAIIEVSGDSVDQLGVQWVMGGPNSGYGVTNFGNTGVSVTSLATAAALAKTNPVGVSSALSKVSGALLGLGKISKNNEGQARFFGAILQAIKTTSNANLLSMPSILTLDNEQANILVGQNVPFITGSTTNTTGSTQTIERKDVGINLSVIPHIGDGGTIRLEVSQEVSAVVPTASNIRSSDIITNRRLIKTTVLADDQQTIALGGLMSDDTSNSSSKVPLLGDLPVLGGLFRSSSASGTKRNLIVFLQPTILHDGKQLSQLSQRRYQHLKMLQLELDTTGNLKKIPLNFGSQ